MGKVYYNQADSRWANHPYTAPGYPNATTKSAGCGPTCAAMIVSSCKEIIYPDRMCDISKEQGYRVSGGTADGLFSYIANRWGIQMEQIHSSFEAHERCKNGWFVVMCCKSGLWTTGGHFILAVGANDSEIEIYDPYLYNGKFNTSSRRGKVRLEGTSAWVEINTFKANSNVQRLYAFKIGDAQPVNPTPQNERVAWVNTSSLNLNVRSTPNGTIVGSLAKGTQIVVYEEQNGWCRIGTNKWCSAQYVTYTQPQNIPNTVGQTKVFASNTKLWSNSNLTGTRYDYLSNTSVVVLQNVSASVDKVRVVKTGREAYVSTSAYKGGSSSTSSIPNTVGQVKVFKSNTTIYSKSSLSGTKYNYLPNTSVIVLQNVSSTVDKVKVRQTGRVGYVNKNNYK